MYYDNIDMREAIEDIRPITFNWCFIRLCYEVWKKEIYNAWGKEVKLNEIAGVSVNYMNELCNGKKLKTYNTFRSEGHRGIQEYLMGVSEFGYAPPKLKEFIVLNNLYNKVINEKRKSKISPRVMEEKENELSRFCKGNKKIDEYIKYLKESCIQVIGQQPLSTAEGEKNSLKYIKDYLCNRAARSIVTEKEKELLVSLHMHTMEWDCETVANVSDESLDILYEDMKILFNRVKAEKYYREVREKEKDIRRKELEITVKKISKNFEIYDEVDEV